MIEVATNKLKDWQNNDSRHRAYLTTIVSKSIVYRCLLQWEANSMLFYAEATSINPDDAVTHCLGEYTKRVN